MVLPSRVPHTTAQTEEGKAPRDEAGSRDWNATAKTPFWRFRQFLKNRPLYFGYFGMYWTMKAKKNIHKTRCNRVPEILRLYYQRQKACGILSNQDATGAFSIGQPEN